MQTSLEPQSPFLIWGAAVFFAVLTTGIWWMITGLKVIVANWAESRGKARPDAGAAAGLSTLERTWLVALLSACCLIAISTVSSKAGLGPTYFLSVAVEMLLLSIAAGIVEYFRLMFVRTGLYAVYDVLAWIGAFLFVMLLLGIVVHYIVRAVSHLIGG
jgi:hypothetical protein